MSRRVACGLHPPLCTAPGTGDRAPRELFTRGNLLGSLSVTGERLGKEPGFGLCAVVAPETATRFHKAMAGPGSGKPKKLHRVILCSLSPGFYGKHSYASVNHNYFLKAIISTNKGNSVELTCVCHIQNARTITEKRKLFVG